MKQVLLPAGAIKRLPPCAHSWCDTSDKDTCIFSAGQKKIYNLDHFQECCWYLDCPKNFVPSAEVELKTRLSGLVVVPDEEEEEGEEPVCEPLLETEKSSG